MHTYSQQNRQVKNLWTAGVCGVQVCACQTLRHGMFSSSTSTLKDSLGAQMEGIQADSLSRPQLSHLLFVSVMF